LPVSAPRGLMWGLMIDTTLRVAPPDYRFP
jgi:hypothetical protein